MYKIISPLYTHSTRCNIHYIIDVQNYLTVVYSQHKM